MKKPKKEPASKSEMERTSSVVFVRETAAGNALMRMSSFIVRANAEAPEEAQMSEDEIRAVIV